MILYYLAPKKARNAVLLLASLVFYGWGEPRYLLVMLGSTALGYLFGLAIGAAKKPAARRALLTASILSCLGVLVYFK